MVVSYLRFARISMTGSTRSWSKRMSDWVRLLSHMLGSIPLEGFLAWKTPTSTESSRLESGEVRKSGSTNHADPIRIEKPLIPESVPQLLLAE